MTTTWSLRPSVRDDAMWLADLRAVVLRSDLERLGRFDELGVRTRFLGAFEASRTRVIVVDSQDAGSITVHPDDGSIWIEHFYLRPEHQGRGVGSGVLTMILDEIADLGQPIRLNVLQGSDAQRLYERFGFVVETEDQVDVFMLFDPARASARD